MRLALALIASLSLSACASRGHFKVTQRPKPQLVSYGSLSGTAGTSGLTPTAAVDSASLGISGTAKAGKKKAAKSKEKPKPKIDEFKKYGWTRKPNKAYAVGEKLTFAVQYFSITAGYATLSAAELVEVDGRPCVHIVAEARTHPAFESIFKVRDRIESFIDAETLFPWRYEKHLREGSYVADSAYIYDHRAGKMLEPSRPERVTLIPPDTQDVISCFYLFRTMPLIVGESLYIKVAADDMKNYELKVDVLKRERVKTLAGDFDCIKVQPHLKFEGVFQQKGEIFVWVTDDERHIPVKIRSKIAIGSININLQEAEWVQPE